MSAAGAQQAVPASPARRERSPKFAPALLAIVAAGVVIRVLYTLLEAPWPPPALDDQFYFSAVPKLLADGEGFIAPFKFFFRGVTVPTAEHPPLYSFVLTIPAELGLRSPDSQRLAGTVFGAGTIAAVGVLGRMLAGNRAGLLAAGLAAVYPALISADGALMSESLYGMLVGFTLIAAYRFVAAPAPGRAALLGGLAGLAALTRGEGLVLLPLLLLPPLLVPALRRPGGGRGALVAVLAFALVLAPWSVRNWSVFDTPVLVATNSGTAIAGANCDDTYRGERLGGWYPPCIKEHPGNEAEHHAEALRDGVRYAGDHASRLPVVLAARLGRVWSLYDPLQLPEGRSQAVHKLGLPMFFVLVALSVVGGKTLRRRGVTLWILLVPFALVSITALATYGNMRFREPAELSLVVLAGVALDELWRRRERGRRRRPPARAPA